MKLKKMTAALTGAGLLTLGSIGAAQAFTDQINVSGFGTVAYSETDTAKPIGSVDKSGNWDKGTLVGVQFDGRFTQNLGATVQLMVSDDPVRPNELKPTVEMAFLSLQATDNMRLRAGQLRAPFYLNSEFINVGNTQLGVVKPESVYDQAPFNNYTGLDAVFMFDIGMNTLEIQPFVGQTTVEVDNGMNLGDADLNYMVGVSFKYSTFDWSLRAAHVLGNMTDKSMTSQQIDMVAGMYGVDPSQVTFNKDNGTFTTLGFSYETDLVIQAEYANRKVENALMFADMTGGYLLAGYHFGSMTPYVSVQSLRTADKNTAIGVNHDFDALGVGVRYNMNNVALKLQADQFTYKHPGMGHNMNFDKMPDPQASTPGDFEKNVTRISFAVSTVF
ncbi:hypothetical protein [Thiomicrospira microaerophila]|uniref:hypothetical protein n=1 Tax=Thiomicrospira microaerophila TaxID=406020 RepID=UPI0005CA3DEB|nr:hypothetical protein [Thiomicrospira microaerophila]